MPPHEVHAALSDLQRHFAASTAAVLTTLDNHATETRRILERMEARLGDLAVELQAIKR